MDKGRIMKDKLGYIGKTNLAKSSFPKDYWNDGGNQNNKYLTLRSSFKFSDFYFRYNFVPLVVLDNEVELSFFDDLTDSYNIFIRDKLTAEIHKGCEIKEELDF